MEDNNGAVANRPQYSAFISYSHADTVVARKLHAQLESYRLPKGLGRERLGKFFRDREDLSAAENLSDAVVDALTRSEVLLVVCSPDAQASRWVAQEIAYFREHCPGCPILAAIVRGEPADAFPPALTEGGVEPLAADLRKAGDGWKLGFLKIVAGIAGVPLDALIQRDSQRQMRRVMAVTGVTALIALAMVGMTMVALKARNEAESATELAHARAEETAALNTYLITDFREVLLERSQLDVALELYPKVYEYCLSASESMSFGDEAELSCLQHMRILGTDLVSAGRMKEAKTFFDLASQLSAERLRINPSDDASRFEHYLSLGREGFFYHTLGDYRNAVKSFGSSLALIDSIDAENLASGEGVRHKSYAHASLAKSLVKLDGSSARALREATKAVELSCELLEETKDRQAALSDLAFHLQIMANAQMTNGFADAAYRSSGVSVGIVDALGRQEPQNVFFREQRMMAHLHHAAFAKAIAKDVVSGRHMNLARRLQQSLQQDDPNNKDYQFDMSKEVEL